MSANPYTPIGECPVCGASIPPNKNFTSCPACGSPLPKSFAFQTRKNKRTARELEDLLNAMNERLTVTGAEISDRAFNLGCGLGILLLVIWGIAVYFIGGRNWLLLIIAVLVFSLAVLWLVILITDVSRNRAIDRVYRDEVQPELDGYSNFRQIEMSKIEKAAYAELPEKAPLLKFLPRPPAAEEGDE